MLALSLRRAHNCAVAAISPLIIRNFSKHLKPATGSSERRKFLPEELSRSKNVVALTCESSTAKGGVCDVYLVGTRHCSKESCREIEAIISYFKPEIVFLELCRSRTRVLTQKNLKVPTMKEIIEAWKKRNMNVLGILLSWSFTKSVADESGFLPQSEFHVAYGEAMKYGGRVALGDRPFQITLERTWGKMTLWHKLKLPFLPYFLAHVLAHVLTEQLVQRIDEEEILTTLNDIKQILSQFSQQNFRPGLGDLHKILGTNLKDDDDVDMITVLEIIRAMRKAFPILVETILDERDQYMSGMLLSIARQRSSVVAIVGKAHLQGIKKHWKQPLVIKDLLEVPPQKAAISAVEIFKTLGGVVAVVVILLSGISFAILTLIRLV